MFDFAILTVLNSLEFLVLSAEANRMGIISDETYKDMLNQMVDADHPKTWEDWKVSILRQMANNFRKE